MIKFPVNLIKNKILGGSLKANLISNIKLNFFSNGKLLNVKPALVTPIKPSQFIQSRFYRVYNQRPQTLTSTLKTRFQNPDAIAYTIIGANVAVFLIIQLLYLEKDQRKLMRLKYWVHNNLCISYNNIQQHRYWTLLTNGFCHENFGHFLTNVITLYFFAFPVLHSLGTKRFLTLYIGSGLSASILFLTFFNKEPTLRNQERSKYVTSLGASGHTMGLLTYFALKYPFEQIILLFIPMPAILLVGGYIVYDLFSFNTKENTMFGLRINHIGHLGGALAGALMFLWTKRIPPQMRYGSNNLKWRGRG